MDEKRDQIPEIRSSVPPGAPGPTVRKDVKRSRATVVDVLLGIVAVLAVAVVVRGVVLLATDPGEAALSTPSPPASAEETSSPAPESASFEDLQARCESPGPVDGTAAYQGPGPHPVALFEGPPWFDGSRVSELTDLPEGWTADSGADAQLLLCALVETKKKVDVCEYEDGTTYHVWSADYTFTLYEAATGRVIDEVTAFADGSGYSCPPVIWSDGDDGGLIADPPGDKARAMLEAAITAEL